MNFTYRYLVYAAIVSGLLAPTAWSQVDDLPIVVAEEKWRPLYDRVDTTLQKRLEARLGTDPAWKQLIGAKKMAVGLVDLSRPDSALFARINGRTMMYAASLPKIAIMLAVVQAFEDGALQETPEIVEDLNNTMRVSSNRGATRLYNLVGAERIQKILTDPRYRLYDKDRGGGLWVGKPYSSQEAVRRRDPLNGLIHSATVTQVCRFYYMLATGRLINPERSRQMLSYMVAPGVHHKFVHTLDDLAPKAHIYRKSGTWRRWHADSVLVWGPEWRRYILVGLIEDERGSKILEELVPAVEEVLRR